jgi:hypothetical protein
LIFYPWGRVKRGFLWKEIEAWEEEDRFAPRGENISSYFSMSD